MPFNINHIHLKAHDPKVVADWWVKAFNFTIVSDTVRDVGDRFVACRSENGITVNISGARTGETLGPGDANAHEGLEHFGFDSDNLEADLARLTNLGAVVLQAPPPPSTPPVQRICFIRCPDNIRIELDTHWCMVIVSYNVKNSLQVMESSAQSLLSPQTRLHGK